MPERMDVIKGNLLVLGSENKLSLQGECVRTICDNYFDECFGAEKYDCVVSGVNVHDFVPAVSIGLYEKIFKALKPGGRYIEYAYDTPCINGEQIRILKDAGFFRADKVCCEENTTVIVGDKLKYFCTEKTRRGTCYHEFQKGKWGEQTFWKKDSLLLHDDVHLELKLYGLFKQILPNYDAYGDVEVNRTQWQAILDMAEEIGGETFEAMKEADAWVQECFETEEVFYMLGI